MYKGLLLPLTSSRGVTQRAYAPCNGRRCPSRRDATQRAYAPCNGRRRALNAFTDEIPCNAVCPSCSSPLPCMHLQCTGDAAADLPSTRIHCAADGSSSLLPKPELPHSHTLCSGAEAQVGPPLAHSASRVEPPIQLQRTSRRALASMACYGSHRCHHHRSRLLLF